MVGLKILMNRLEYVQNLPEITILHTTFSVFL